MEGSIKSTLFWVILESVLCNEFQVSNLRDPQHTLLYDKIRKVAKASTTEF